MSDMLTWYSPELHDRGCKKINRNTNKSILLGKNHRHLIYLLRIPFSPPRFPWRSGTRRWRRPSGGCAGFRSIWRRRRRRPRGRPGSWRRSGSGEQCSRGSRARTGRLRISYHKPVYTVFRMMNYQNVLECWRIGFCRNGPAIERRNIQYVCQCISM